MDFFAHEDRARAQTRRLVVLFVLSLAAIVAVIYLPLALLLNLSQSDDATVEQALRTGAIVGMLWDPGLLLVVAGGTLLVVMAGSLYKIAELASGGEPVALMMGGQVVSPQTSNLAQRRLLNVVEEMALASGVPVPPVYVLPDEPGINAFAAGHQPQNAVVAVSQGCLDQLTREELQGVVGHEFSHILNGDMRLNIRLIGVVHGLLVIALLGYCLMRLAEVVSSGDSKKSEQVGAAAALFFGGIFLYCLGYLGVFFGNLIKAAISRQREFLADASAVQFTRDSSGIAGALKKIGGFTAGSEIHSAHAQEVSHMFFGDAIAGRWFQLFATHPPLEERIRRIDRSFDESPNDRAAPQGEPSETAEDASSAAMGFQASRSSPSQAHLQRANQMRTALPEPLVAAAREPLCAQAIVLAFLFNRDDPTVRSRQLDLLSKQIDPWLQGEMDRQSEAALALPVALRLPLVDLSIPALKHLSPPQYARFRQAIDSLIRADGRIDLFEYALRTMLLSYLDIHFGRKKQPPIRYRTVQAVAAPATAVLSVLARSGQNSEADIDRAFQAGTQSLSMSLALQPSSQCTLAGFDAAITELAQATPQVKHSVLEAASAIIAADGQVLPAEAELLRALAASLGCPLPPALGC